MPSAKFKDEFYKYPSIVKPVNAMVTGTTPADLWTPALGKKFKIMGYQLSVKVAVVLVTGKSVLGDTVVIYDEATTAVFGTLGMILEPVTVVGSLLHTSHQDTTAAAPAFAAGTSLIPPPVHIPGGYTSTAAGNDVKAVCVDAADGTTVQDLGTGGILITGTVWGHEV